jgi:glycerophosphoryl diester phosphodiesterase
VHPFLVEPGPIAFAHRGGAGEAPENTLAAFEIALTLGYEYLETDVHLTRDGVLVAFHDERLDRVTDRTGAIAELGIAEVDTASGLMRRLGADCIQVPISRGPIPIVTERFIAAAHRAGLPVHVWTINEEATINELLDLGVDGIMSDRLRLLRDVLTRRGLALTGQSAQRRASTSP